MLCSVLLGRGSDHQKRGDVSQGSDRRPRYHWGNHEYFCVPSNVY